jgi:parvulin-like peptidyl-prolyl isomerase
VIIHYKDKSISSDAVLKHLVLTGHVRPLLFEIIKSREAALKARELGLEASDEQLQDFADAFRAANGLYTAQETYGFLSENGLSDEDFENFCEASILTSQLRDHLGEDNKVREYFITHRAQFDRARISVITTANADLADEIKLQIEEEELDFAGAAVKYSLDPAGKQAGGHVGLVPRQAFAPEVSAKVFNADTNDLLGPFEAGDAFQLVLVHEVQRAELSPELQEVIKDAILNEWAERWIRDGIRIEHND